jgi:hypothetical protein
VSGHDAHLLDVGNTIDDVNKDEADRPLAVVDGNPCPSVLGVGRQDLLRGGLGVGDWSNICTMERWG